MHKYTVILFSARSMDTEYDIAFHEGTVYMFEDTGLDVSHEVYDGREGQTACWGKILRLVRATTMACQGKLRRVGATITACRGKLRCVGANYDVSGQITAYRGKLRCVGQQLCRVEANYVVSMQITECQGQITACQGQITSCQGKLRRVGENCVVSGQFTSCRGKL